MKKYKLAACGGTFDLFHLGHKDFLNSIYKQSEKIIIGITSDKFASNSKLIYESFEQRKKSVEEYVVQNNINSEIIEIDDIYGPTTSEKNKFDALFVTTDSLNGAEKINERRHELGLSELRVITVPIIKTKDGQILSSTRIKKGQINRNGEIYIDKELLSYDYLLPENLRDLLSEPFGELSKKIDFKNLGENIITVGDETTKNFISNKVYPRICIVDLKNNREKKYKNISELGLSVQNVIYTSNPSGHITKNLFEAVKEGLKINNSVILIDGEEDLAVIPAVLASPLGFRIYYGQPGKGVVEILVTEEKKREMKDLISKFDRKVL